MAKAKAPAKNQFAQIEINHMTMGNLDKPAKGFKYYQDNKEPRLWLKVGQVRAVFVTNPGESETVLGRHGSVGRAQAIEKIKGNKDKGIEAIADIGEDKYEFSGMSAEEKKIEAERKKVAEAQAGLTKAQVEAKKKKQAEVRAKYQEAHKKANAGVAVDEKPAAAKAKADGKPITKSEPTKGKGGKPVVS